MGLPKENEIRLFVSDLDGTLLGKPDATSAFGRSKRAAEPLMVGVQCGLSF